MLRLATRIALVLALIGALGAARAQAAGGIGNSAPSGQAILRQPQALAFDADGNLLVGDRWGYMVQRFDGSHALSGSWGEFGAGNGQFGAIGGIAIGPDRSMYVLDIDQDRVEKFVPDGGGYRFALAWGGFDIRFKGDLAVGPNGRVYVADTYNHRVVWFDSSGRMLGQLGETNVPGSDARHFSYPEGIAFDAAGDLYVADDRNNRIQKFSPAGALLASIGQPGELDNPYDVGVDSSQNVYVADNMHHRVVKYAADTAGLQYALAATWGGRGDAPGQMLTPRSIVVQPDGTNYVTDTGGGRIAVFDSAGTLLSSFGLNGRDGGRLTGPMGLALDQGGSMLVADALQYRVQRLAADGSMAAFLASHGDGAEQLWLAEGAAAAADGGTWVADTGNNRVQRFDAAGNASAVIGGFSAPRGIAVDGSGSVFVADTGAGRVVKLDANGAQLAAWGGLQAPADVAVNGFGVVYVADSAAKRVVVLDGTGKQLSSWDGTGTNPDRRGPAAFDTPTGVGIDPSGNVWVADPGAAHLSKFAPDGTWLANYGARGHGAGESWTAGPRDVAAADGYALASDPYDNEVDRIDTPPAASAPAIANGKAWDIGAATAAVGETLDTHGLQTSYWLELGETTAY